MTYHVIERTPCPMCAGTGRLREYDKPGEINHATGERMVYHHVEWCENCNWTGHVDCEVLLVDALAALGLIAGAMDK
jgi:RecJ-like exonuclease